MYAASDCTPSQAETYLKNDAALKRLGRPRTREQHLILAGILDVDPEVWGWDEECEIINVPPDLRLDPAPDVALPTHH